MHLIGARIDIECGKMSEIDRQKSDNERCCFQEALELSRRVGGTTRSILELINGKEIARDKNDVPDIIHVCQRGNKHKYEVCVGIEHFQVNQLSRGKGDKRLAIGQEYKKHIFDAYEKGHTAIEEGEDIPKDLYPEFLTRTLDYLSDSVNSRIEQLIDDLRYSLGKHLERVDAYRNNVKTIAIYRQVEIAFLIEIHAKFPEIILNGEYVQRASKDGELIFVEEIAEILSSISKDKVDYIIMLFYGEEFQQATDVVAIRSGNVVKHLKNQKREVFVNAFQYSELKDLKITHKENANGDFDIEQTWRMDEYSNLKEIFKNVRIAYDARMHRKPYATNITVQAFLNTIYNYVKSFDEDTNEPILKRKTGKK